MTTAPITDQPDVGAILSRLEREFAANPTDVRGSNIANIRSAATLRGDVDQELARFRPLLVAEEHLRKQLCDELFDVPSPIRTAQARAAHRTLTLSIQVLDRGPGVLADTGCALETLRLGQLMREAGYEQNVPPPSGEIGLRLPWFGSIPEVTRRIRKLEERKKDAQARLDAALADVMS